jgi:hypothetical protein
MTISKDLKNSDATNSKIRLSDEILKTPNLMPKTSLQIANRNKGILKKNDLKTKNIPHSDRITKLLREKQMHENKIRLLKKETKSVINEVSGIEHLSSKTIQLSLIKNKILSSKEDMTATEENEKFEKALTKLNYKRMSINRRKSSVFKDVYEVFVKDANIEMEKTKDFTKNHIFDVYLDDEYKPHKNERLPSIINLYNKAEKLRLIEKLNPTSSKNFEEIVMKSKADILKKPNPKYDLKSKVLAFDGGKARKGNLIYE